MQVVGNWDDGTAQKVTADAIAVHGQFDAVTVQGGSTGTVQAMMDAGHPFVPVAGESENGFRKLIAEHADEGLKGISIGQSPGLVAISMKAAISALEGNPMPQLISVPLPVADHTTLKDGENFWSDLPDNFFTVNEFPPCGVNVSGPAIMAQTEADMSAADGRAPAEPPSSRTPHVSYRRLQALPGRPRPGSRRLRLPPPARSTPSSARTAPASRR